MSTVQWSEAALVFKAAYMNGRDVCKLMRQHGVTIRDLKARTGITLRRIRDVRMVGLAGPYQCRDWVEMITGRDPGNTLDHPMIHKTYR